MEGLTANILNYNKDIIEKKYKHKKFNPNEKKIHLIIENLCKKLKQNIYVPKLYYHKDKYLMQKINTSIPLNNKILLDTIINNKEIINNLISFVNLLSIKYNIHMIDVEAYWYDNKIYILDFGRVKKQVGKYDWNNGIGLLPPEILKDLI